MIFRCLALVVILSTALGCEVDRTTSTERSNHRITATAPAIQDAADSSRRRVAPQPSPELPESAFVRSEENRDPFAPMASPEQVMPPPNDVRLPLVLGDRSLDEIRLIAVVTSEDGAPRAMLVGPDGQGYSVTRGYLVGRGEGVAQSRGAILLDHVWRVERIRPDRVILTRRDPANPESSVVRVLRLHPEDEIARQGPRGKSTTAS